MDTKYTPQNQYRVRLRQQIFDHYGRTCKACGFNADDRFLTIDHINGLSKDEQGKKRIGGYAFYLQIRREGFPDKYQTLCSSCNYRKQHRYKQD